MRYAGVAVSMALGVAALAGCGSDDSGSASGTAGSADATATESSELEPADVAVVSFSYTDFNQAEEQGLKATVEPGGGSVKWLNANFDPQKLLKDCQDAISSGRYNAIVLLSVDGPTGVPCVTAAKAAEIPVITMESAVGDDPEAIEPNVDGVVGAISITPTPNADNMVALTKEACADLDPCQIIAEVVTPSDVLTTEVVDRVKADVPGAEIVQTFAGQYDPSVMAKAIPDALSAHPDADVLLTTADSQALAALPAVRDAGLEGQIKLIGNGGSRLGAKAVADGTLFGSAGNFPYQHGVVAGEMAIAAVNGQPIEKPGVDALTLGSPRIVTKETVEEFEPEWGAQ